MKFPNLAPSSPSRKQVAVLFLVLMTVAVSWLGIVDRKSEEYIDSATIQALTAFGTARAINGGVSLLQSVEVGVGVASTQPMALLAPLHDLIEDYSTAMKLSLGSLVTQKVLLEISSTNIFKIILTLSALLLASSLFFKKSQYTQVFTKIFLLIALVRFLFVASILLNALVDQAFIEEKTAANIESTSRLSQTVSNIDRHDSISSEERQELNHLIDRLNQKKEELLERQSLTSQEIVEARNAIQAEQTRLEEFEDEMSTMERVNVFRHNEEHERLEEKLDQEQHRLEIAMTREEDISGDLETLHDQMNEAQDTLNGKQGWLSSVSAKVSAIRDSANLDNITTQVQEATSAFINLMALFLFKTLLLPLTFLYLLIKGFKALWGIDPRTLARREFDTIKQAK